VDPAASSSLSAPRATIFKASSDRGAAAPSPYPMARIHTSRSASEGRPVKINSARDRCAPPSRKLLPELSVESYPLEGSGKTGKVLHMKKTVLALATAATVGFATLAAPSPAHAWRGGWGPGLAAGLIGAAVIGGIASSAYAYGPGYGYYGGYPGYGYYDGYYDGYAPAYYGGYSSYYAPAYYGPRYRRVVRPAYAYYAGPRYHRWHRHW
jgi:hypothetical protein